MGPRNNLRTVSDRVYDMAAACYSECMAKHSPTHAELVPMVSKCTAVAAAIAADKAAMKAAYEAELAEFNADDSEDTADPDDMVPLQPYRFIGEITVEEDLIEYGLPEDSEGDETA
jgi:hypothetical protein